MNVLQLILDNFKNAPVTLRYPERARPAEGLRGPVENDLQACIGCGACAYVCAPAAITVTDRENGFEWRYDPGQCTYCGRCVEYCTMKCLSMQGDRPAVYRQRDSVVRLLARDYPPCPECGKPAPVLPDVKLALLYGLPLREAFAETRGLCPTCRQKATVRRSFANLDVMEGSRGQ
jgi:ferredoxin